MLGNHLGLSAYCRFAWGRLGFGNGDGRQEPALDFCTHHLGVGTLVTQCKIVGALHVKHAWCQLID